MGWVSLVSCIVVLFASLTKMLGYIAAFLMTEICINKTCMFTLCSLQSLFDCSCVIYFLTSITCFNLTLSYLQSY